MDNLEMLDKLLDTEIEIDELYEAGEITSLEYNRQIDNIHMARISCINKEVSNE